MKEEEPAEQPKEQSRRRSRREAIVKTTGECFMQGQAHRVKLAFIHSTILSTCYIAGTVLGTHWKREKADLDPTVLLLVTV